MNMAATKLAEYLEREGVRKIDFARRVGLSSGGLSHLLQGRRTPGLKLAVEIELETGGFVRPRDWLTPS